MAKIEEYEDENVKFLVDPDVNIIVGEHKGKSKILQAINRTYDNTCLLDLSTVNLDVTKSITDQVSTAIFDAVRNKANHIVLIDLVCDLLFVTNQQTLIDDCLKINPDVQLFIVTNSLNILYDGWEMRPININRILKQK